MRTFLALVVFSAANGLAAANALADTPSSEWAGPYAGIGPSSAQISASTAPFTYLVVQLNAVNISGRGVVIVPGTDRPANNSASGSNALGSVRAGYAWQSGHFVWGFEGEYGTGGGSSTSTSVQRLPDTAVAQGVTVTSQRSVALSSSSALRARLGYAATHDLVYVTGGPASVNVTIGGVDTMLADPSVQGSSGPCPGPLCRANLPIDPLTATTSQRQSHTGTVLGAGWAHRASRWTIVALEYTRTSLASRNYIVNDRFSESCSVTVPNVGTCTGSLSDPSVVGPRAIGSPHSFNVTTNSLSLRLDVKLR